MSWDTVTALSALALASSVVAAAGLAFVFHQTSAGNIARLWSTMRDLMTAFEELELRTKRVQAVCLEVLEDAEHKRKSGAASLSKARAKNGAPGEGEPMEVGSPEWKAHVLAQAPKFGSGQ